MAKVKVNKEGRMWEGRLSFLNLSEFTGFGMIWACRASTSDTGPLFLLKKKNPSQITDSWEVVSVEGVPLLELEN